MADSDAPSLRDPSYAAGRVLRLEAELEGERSARAELREKLELERQEREDHDTLVSAALSDMKDAVGEVQGELVRQGGVLARTLRLSEATAKRLGVDPETLEVLDAGPVLSRMHEAEEAIQELRRRGRRDTHPDVPEARPASERPITKSWRPRSAADWGRLAVYVAIAFGALGTAIQQLVQAIAGH